MFTHQNNILCPAREKGVFLIPQSNIVAMCEAPIAPWGLGSSHSLVLTWLTASSLRQSTKRRLTLKIKSRHHQHFLTYYTSCRGVVHKRNRSDYSLDLEETKKQSQSFVWARMITLTRSRNVFVVFFLVQIWRSGRGSLECTSGFNMLRRKGLQQHLPAHGKVNAIGENVKGQAAEIIEHLNHSS